MSKISKWWLNQNFKGEREKNMDIEEVLKRADVHTHTDFDDTNGVLVTTWIVSKSDNPLTKEEALVIEQ